MEKKILDNLIASYQEEGGGFIVHTAAQLKILYDAARIDPRSTDRRIFDLESLAHFLQKGVIDLFNKLEIKKDDIVLSVGEGNGSPSRLLAKLIGCKIVGVDINPDQIQKARECAVLHRIQDNVEYVLQNAEELNLNRRDFTKAFLNETTCHWEDKKKAFSKIYQHLVPGAKIGLNEWIKGDKGTLNDAYLKISEFTTLYKEKIWFQEDLNKYNELLASSGFKVLVTEDCTDKIDVRLRARLKVIQMQDNYYSKSMGDEALKLAVDYYNGMIKTHYDYLRYGIIIAEKT
jgi:ubiquinone/menaquinone biosynthesis C-methylase UbiE